MVCKNRVRVRLGVQVRGMVSPIRVMAEAAPQPEQGPEAQLREALLQLSGDGDAPHTHRTRTQGGGGESKAKGGGLVMVRAREKAWMERGGVLAG